VRVECVITSWARRKSLSKKREVGFILFLDLLLPPLFHTIPNIGLETEAKSDNRIPNTMGSERTTQIQMKWKVLGVEEMFVFLQTNRRLYVDEEQPKKYSW